MTGTDIEARAREILKDKDEGDQTWTPDAMARWINDGVKAVCAIRGDALLDSNGLITVTELSAITGTISIANKWRSPLAWFVVWQCFASDAGDKRDAGRAADAKQTFLDLVRMA